MMPVGVLFVAVWCVAAVLYLLWQFATDALAAPAAGESLVLIPVADQDALAVDVAVGIQPAGTLSGAGLAG